MRLLGSSHFNYASQMQLDQVHFFNILRISSTFQKVSHPHSQKKNSITNTEHLLHFDSRLSEFNFRRCIVRSILVWLNILIGEFIPKFDIVMGELVNCDYKSRHIHFLFTHSTFSLVCYWDFIRRDWRYAYRTFNIHSSTAVLHSHETAGGKA